MKEYLLITIIKSSLGNAGPKAPRDISDILEKTGRVESVVLETEDGMDYPVFLQLIQILKKAAQDNRNIILQYPLQPYQYHEKQQIFAEAFSYLNPDKTFMWIHDINQIRFTDRPVYREEMEWLKPVRRFIVHNSAMEKYLRKYLVMDCCIHNEVFDYICSGNRGRNSDWMERGGLPLVVSAGNLDYSKTPFLYQLEAEKMDFQLNVYGRRTTVIKNEKISYQGSFEADMLPEHIRGDLGLIWDGMADARLDTLAQRNYTRYNVPHKFSCYMAAGIPVIAWKNAAIAETIQKYRVGYLIEDLYEINRLDWSVYQEYQDNVLALSEKVRSGYFTKRVFERIERAGNNNQKV